MAAGRGGSGVPVLEPEQARRLALRAQRLASPPPPVVGAARLLKLVELICYLQRDPLSVVAPSHELVLWSRLGEFRPGLVEEALWRRRSLIELFTHGASIVPTSDLWLHRPAMAAYGRGPGLEAQRSRAWVRDHPGLRREILLRLAHEGPLPASALDGRRSAPDGARARPAARVGWGELGETERMLFHLWREGRVVVASREGRARRWALSSDWVAPASPCPSAAGWEAELAERCLRALGVATWPQIRDYLGRSSQRLGERSLARLVREGRVVEVGVAGAGGRLPGRWYLRRADLEVAQRSLPEPSRTTLLSPFDNLLALRSRSRALFGFDFRMETYVPAAQRRFGYYVLAVLHRDRLVGRVDLRRDRLGGRLLAPALHAEPGAPDTEEVGAGIREALLRLGRFLGAEELALGPLDTVPRDWWPGLVG